MTTPSAVAPASRAGAGRTGARMDARTSGRIGPNAILQPFAVLFDAFGEGPAAEVLVEATSFTAATLPSAMVDEREAAALMRAIAERWPGARGAALLREAGERTGAYVLANRIPRPVCMLLRALPRAVGARLLTRAMARHAWTFAGSGRFTATHGRTAGFIVTGCPLCAGHRAAAPWCEYYAGALEHLLRALVDPQARVIEVECEAAGGEACRFVAR